MNKFFLIIITLCLSVVVYSQNTQQGIVKTRGRLGVNGTVVKGTGVADAVIVVDKGNTVKSRKDGRFSFAVKDWYSIGSVTKKGYVL